MAKAARKKQSIKARVLGYLFGLPILNIVLFGLPLLYTGFVGFFTGDGNGFVVFCVGVIFSICPVYYWVQSLTWKSDDAADWWGKFESDFTCNLILILLNFLVSLPLGFLGVVFLYDSLGFKFSPFLNKTVELIEKIWNWLS